MKALLLATTLVAATLAAPAGAATIVFSGTFTDDGSGLATVALPARGTDVGYYVVRAVFTAPALSVHVEQQVINSYDFTCEDMGVTFNCGGDDVPVTQPMDYGPGTTEIDYAYQVEPPYHLPGNPSVDGYFHDDGGTLTYEFSAPGRVGYTITNFDVSDLPEPAGWAMMIGGIGAIGGTLRRRRSSARARLQGAM